MVSSFQKALHFVLLHECEFAHGHDGDLSGNGKFVVAENVDGDSGGVTKFGIDQSSHPHVNIRALDLAGASQIYHDEEWTKCRCDDLPEGFDIATFDIAVNNGMGTAATMLQRALNEGCGAKLAVDGHIGPVTVSAAQYGNCAAGLQRLIEIRQSRYFAIVSNNPDQKEFLKGWLNRNNDLAALIGVSAFAKIETA